MLTFEEKFHKNSSQATRHLLQRIQCMIEQLQDRGNILPAEIIADINTVLKSGVGRGRFVRIVEGGAQ